MKIIKVSNQLIKEFLTNGFKRAVNIRDGLEGSEYLHGVELDPITLELVFRFSGNSEEDEVVCPTLMYEVGNET